MAALPREPRGSLRPGLLDDRAPELDLLGEVGGVRLGRRLLGGTGLVPSSAKRATTFWSCSAVCSASLSSAITSGGVPAGA